MADERVELVRRIADAYSRGDYEAATEGLHPDVVLVPPGNQSPYRGVGEVREWMKPDAFARQATEARSFKALGGRLLVEMHSSVKGAGSGIEMEFDFWTVWAFDDRGLVTRMESYLDRADALEAIGLSE